MANSEAAKAAGQVVYMPKEVIAAMDAIRDRESLGNRGDVLKRAVALYDIISQHRAKGQGIYLRDAQNVEREVKFEESTG